MSKLQFEGTVSGLSFITLTAPLTADDVMYTTDISQPVSSTDPDIPNRAVAIRKIFLKPEVSASMLESVLTEIKCGGLQIQRFVQALSHQNRGVYGEAFRRNVILRDCSPETQIQRYNDACKNVGRRLAESKEREEATLLTTINNLMVSAIQNHNDDVRTHLFKVIVKQEDVFTQASLTAEESTQIEIREEKLRAMRVKLAALEADITKEEATIIGMRRTAITRKVRAASGEKGNAEIDAIDARYPHRA